MNIRSVISTLNATGEEVMGPTVLLWHYPNNDIVNGSLLTVESNHFCVLKSRGAIIAYEPALQDEYGNREFAVLDLDGYRIAFGSDAG